MNLDSFYGRRIKRRTGDDPARRMEGVRVSGTIMDEIHEVLPAPALAIPEIEQRAVPAAPRTRRGVRRPKPRA